MKINQFARKKRQLNEAIKKLNYELKMCSDNAGLTIQSLKKKIGKLLSELSPFVTKRYLLKSLGTLAVLFVLQSNQSANAQTFVGPEVNPFGITPGITYFIPAMADMDGDGDIDLLTSDYSDDFGTSFIKYYENIGTAASPIFADPVNDPFGLTQMFGITIPSFADIDGDGDNDLIMGHENDQSNMIYYENVGTSNLPIFGSSVDASEGFNLPIDNNFIDPEFVDIDGDGDLDLLGGGAQYGEYNSYGAVVYYENTGSATSPQFASAEINPFGIANVPVDSFVFPSVGDVDLDGDFDIILGDYYGDIRYYENTGSTTTPNYDTPLVNELGLMGTGDFAFPALADLDNDGDLDLIVGEYLGDANYYENDLAIGINEIDDTDLISIYPNPTNGILKVESDLQITSISVYDQLGKKCYATMRDNQIIDISNLQSGLYIVEIILENGMTYSKKILKN